MPRSPRAGVLSAPSDPTETLGGMWIYLALAVGALFLLKLISTILLATDRAAAARESRSENRKLRERLDRYSG